MSSLTSEARNMCPELMDAVKLIDKLSYTKQYSEVFGDLVDWMVWQHHYPPNEENPIAKYKEEEQQDFLEIFKVIQNETKKLSGLHNKDAKGGWYDPLGKLYECITSKHKSSAMGQYFTPKHIVNLMTEIQMANDVSSDDNRNFIATLDPACGSGRMGLAAASNAMAKGKACWVTMNDLDPICTKMTAANMCLNGVVGEALCSNGLDVTGESYRFGYRVEPLIMQIEPKMRETYRMLMLMQTGQDVKKQYTVRPVSYEQTYLKSANDKILQEFQEKQAIKDEQQRERELNELKEKVQSRMKGTLFANDNTQAENVTKLTPKNESAVERELKRRKPPKDNQPTLF